MPRGGPRPREDGLGRAARLGGRAPLAKKYGFNFGTGVVPGYLRVLRLRQGRAAEPVIAAKTLLRGIGSAAVGGEMIKRMAAPFNGSVEVGDGTIWPERDYLAIAGGTIDQIGLIFARSIASTRRPRRSTSSGSTPPDGLRLPAPAHLAGSADAPRPHVRGGHGSRDHPVVEADSLHTIDGDLYETKRRAPRLLRPRVRII